MSKKQILDDLERENAAWEALLAQIGEARMTEPGVAGHWSIKDIVAHLTGWRQRTVARLRAARNGELPPPPPWPARMNTDDEINGWIYERSRDRSVQQVLEESRETFRQLVDAIAAFPESELEDSHRFPWMEGQPVTAAAFFAHFHEEHEPDMRRWRAESG